MATLSLRRHPARCQRQSWWAWVALLGLLTLSALVNGDARVALLGHPERHLGVVTWVLLFALFCAGQQLVDQITTLARAGVVAAAGLGIYSLWELLIGRPIEVATTTRRLLGPFGSAAVLGAACCLLGPVALGVALDRAENRWWRRAGGISAVLVALAVDRLRHLAARGSVRSRRRSSRPLPCAPAGASPCGALRGWWSPSERWRHDSATSQHAPTTPHGSTSGGSRHGSSLGTRCSGSGPRVTASRVAEGVDDAYERAHRRDTVLPDRAHLGPLDVTLMGGVGAGLLYIGLLGFVGWRAWSLLRSANAPSIGIGLGVIAYGCSNCSCFRSPSSTRCGGCSPVWW